MVSQTAKVFGSLILVPIPDSHVFKAASFITLCFASP